MTISEDEIGKAAQLLQAGRLVAFPTETVYGLGADATNDTAVAAVFAAKGRPTFNPLISHVDDAGKAMALGRFNPDARRLADAFWPGPLTLVVPRTQHCPVSMLASAGLSSIAIRVPSHPIALALIRQADRPIVAPSANPSGGISPTLASHVVSGLGGSVAMVLDGGACSIGIESTVIKCMDGEPVLLRPGGLKKIDVEKILGKMLLIEAMKAGRPDAPGQLEQHYAPRAKVILDVIWPRFDVGLLAFGPKIPRHPGPVLNLSDRGDLKEAAANLFRMMHDLDETGVQTIAVMPIPNEGLGEAINDRLMRAAAALHRR
jgi:L-threonylcarbamoyladenylate synthase